MLYFLLGTNRKVINSNLHKEAEGSALQKVDIFSWDADLVKSIIQSNSLFGEINDGLVFDSLGENEEIMQILMTLFESMQSSKKKFFIIESDVTEVTLDSFKGRNVKVMDFREGKSNGWQDKWKTRRKPSGSADTFNPFGLADALGRASAKEAWIEYERGRLFGIEPEELHGRIWGKVRDMISSQTASHTELDIHPFVHKKAKADFHNWETTKLRKLVDELVSIYHMSRMGGDDLDTAMEKLLISI